MPETEDDIFIIGKSETSDDLMVFEISINSDSPILKGHFPGQAVVPGACMLQLVKDALSITLTTNVQLVKAAQLKFLTPIVPRNDLTLQLSIGYKMTEDGNYKVRGNLTNAGILGFKFQGSFKIAP